MRRRNCIGVEIEFVGAMDGGERKPNGRERKKRDGGKVSEAAGKAHPTLFIQSEA